MILHRGADGPNYVLIKKKKNIFNNLIVNKMSTSKVKNKIYDTARCVVEEMGNDTIKDFKGVRKCKVKGHYMMSVEGVIDLESGNSSKPECITLTTGVFCRYSDVIY